MSLEQNKVTNSLIFLARSAVNAIKRHEQDEEGEGIGDYVEIHVVARHEFGKYLVQAKVVAFGNTLEAKAERPYDFEEACDAVVTRLQKLPMPRERTETHDNA